MNNKTINKNKQEEVLHELPDFDIKKPLILRVVSRAVSLTFIILTILIAAAAILLFTIDMDVTISSNGLLVPSKVINVHSPESGIIKNIFANSGDTVKAQQTIAEFDSSQLMESFFEIESELKLKENDYERLSKNVTFEKRQDEIALDQAKYNLLKAKAEFRDKLLDYFPHINADSLLENYVLGNHINLDYAIAEVYSSQSEIERCELELQMISMKEYDLAELKITIDGLKEKRLRTKEKLEHLVIKSPINGVIQTEGLDRLKGTYLSEGDLITQISGTEKWKVVLFVDENEIHKVKPANKVKIEISAFQSVDNSHLLNASIISIAAEQITAQDKQYSEYTGLYRVTAALDNLPQNYLISEQFKYGYSVKGNIITKSGKLIDLLKEYIYEKI